MSFISNLPLALSYPLKLVLHIQFHCLNAYQMWLSKRWYHWYLFGSQHFFPEIYGCLSPQRDGNPISAHQKPIKSGPSYAWFHPPRIRDISRSDLQNGQLMLVPGLVNIQFKRTGSHGPVEIVGLPINSMVDLSSLLC